jgi:anti-sigma B factor antagonist
MQRTLEDPHLTPGSGLNRSGGTSFMIDRSDHLIRLSVTGDLDMATADSFTVAAVSALRLPIRVLVLDLGGVAFCGAAGVSALVKICRVAMKAGARLVLTNVQPHVRRVLDVVGMSAMIPIAPNREATRSSVGSEPTTTRQRSAAADSAEPITASPVSATNQSRPLQAA